MDTPPPIAELQHGLSDSHFHSAMMSNQGLDVAALLRDLRAAGGGPIVDVAIVPTDLDERRGLSSDYGEVYYTVGLHPSQTGRADAEALVDSIEALARKTEIAAIGETGLDWYREYAPRDRQLWCFYRQLEVARHLGLPVVVHNRNADEDCATILTDEVPARGGVMHCFSSGPQWVGRFLDAGMYISFAGNITFPRATELREALTRVPDERLLLETDAPFLTPHPHRGRPNHPAMTSYTLSLAAELRGVDPLALAERVAENLRRLFGAPNRS